MNIKTRTQNKIAILALILVSGCNVSVDQPTKKEPVATRSMEAIMSSKKMSKKAPILVRVFKEEGVLEVWKKTDSGKFDLASSYEICKWSGKLGPKYAEGDRQAPEGFYSVSPGMMNPNSDYHLSFNIGYPNAFDRVNGRYGQYIMVHGACSSAGCYSMTNDQIEEIYAYAKDAFSGGQKSFQVQAFPFRMTEQNMDRYKHDPNYSFWKMLKVGHDAFEKTRTPPKVDVCEKKYTFNMKGSPTGPASTCPVANTATNMSSYTSIADTSPVPAFSSQSYAAPLASIAGIQEAAVVADWTRRRAKGEDVTPTPPGIRDVTAEYVTEVMKPVTIFSNRMASNAIRPIIRSAPAATPDTIKTKYPRRF